MMASAPSLKSELRPILAGIWIPTETGMLCRLPLKRLHVTALPEFLQAVATQCDGRTSWHMLRSTLVKRWPARQVDVCLASLLKEGALVDSTCLLAAQARIAWSPQAIPPPLIDAQALDELQLAVDEPLKRPIPESIQLRPSHTPLMELLRGRGSARTFEDKPLSLQSVVNVLWSMYGVLDQREDRVRRTIPSGGRLYGLRWFIALLRPLERYPRGLYEIRHHACASDIGTISLQAIKGPVDAAWSTLLKPAVLAFAQAVIYPVANLSLISKKYGNRSLILAMLEVGHTLQNGALAAQIEGAGTIVRGDTVEKEVLSLFGLDDSLYPLPSMVLGAKPTTDQEALAATVDRVVSLHSVPNHSTRLPMRTRFAVAGPVAMGSAGKPWAIWSGGRSENSRLATIKAEAEAWERIGWSNPCSDMRRARFGELGNTIDPRTLVKYSQTQYARANFPYVIFSPRRRYAWTTASRARDGAEFHVLAQCVYALNSLSVEDSHAPYTSSNTSGVAAYTDVETARTRALMELIERDAFARTWLEKKSPANLDEKRLSVSLRHRIGVLREAGYEVALLGLASDHLPVAAIFVQSSVRAFTAVTTGAGFVWEDALDSALSETESRVQRYHGEHDHPPMRATQVISVEGHGNYYRTVGGYKLADWLQSSSGTTIRRKRHGFPIDGPGLLNHFADRGLEVYFCDLTPPLASLNQGRKSLHVVRAFVPGLIPIWFSHGVEPAGMVELPDCHVARGWPARYPVPIHPCI
jgi:ribosomal protein S12 methylthiotransferase accessory factor